MNNSNNLNSKESPYSGICINAFLAYGLYILLVVCTAALIFTTGNYDDPQTISTACIAGIILFVLLIFLFKGMVMLAPNESRVLLLFGKYYGTFRKTGYNWINPFATRIHVSVRLNNLDGTPIKVNDRSGNPILIGLVLVWRIEDTYRATFDVEGYGLASLQKFVSIQADAALREVAARFDYDDDGRHSDQLTLRGGGNGISSILEERLNERLSMAGIHVVEARINYLAYAPEIAAVMLKRQQANAIIAAREKIVEGAVSMVQLALENLEKQQVVELSNERKATIVGNLLMVLCSDDGPQAVIPTQQA